MDFYQIVLTESAEKSYDNIMSFLLAENFQYADMFIRDITNGLSKLSTMPRRGKPMNL